jgi:large subunit ribosomal protein L10
MAEAQTIQKPKPHVTQAKKDIVKELEGKLKSAKIIAIANMEGLPGAQLSNIKKALRGKAEMYMTKRRLMKIAIENVKSEVPHIEEIIPLMKGMPALLFTEENPFSLYKLLKASKSAAPAKEGAESPRDIVIPAGPTPFAPGPVISDLGELGIKAGIEDGKVVVKADSPVIKEGETFSAKLASMLTRLDIRPLEVGLNVNAVFEDGIIYDKKVLDIDEVQFYADLTTAASWAINLSVEAVIPTKENSEILIAKAVRAARGLTMETMFLADGMKDEVVEKAARQANSLASESNFDASWEKTASASTEAPAPQEETPAPAAEEEPAKEETPAESPAEPEPVSEEPKAEEPAPEPAQEEAKEEVAEEPAVEEKTEETPAPASEAPAEPAEEVKEEAKEEVMPEDMPPSAGESETVQHPTDEKAQEQAADLLKNLQEKGTLRDN